MAIRRVCQPLAMLTTILTEQTEFGQVQAGPAGDAEQTA
jgi:hypothetical protein